MRNTGSWSKAWQVMMLPSFSPLFFASCSGSWWGCVCPSQNIRSSWWMVTPLLFYFFLLGTVGAYSGILSTENTWLLFPWERFLFPVTFYFHPQLDQRKERRKEAFFFFSPFLYAVSSVCWLPTYFIGGQNPLVPGCFWTSALVTKTSSVFSFPSLHTQPGDNEINFVQIKSKQCSENYWHIDCDNSAPR